jgi:hypothetical protein
MGDFTEIIDGLWMGGEQIPTMPSGFDAVCDCKELPDYSFIGGPAFLHLPMIDGPTIPDEFLLEAGMRFVWAAMFHGKKVLVHCAEGHNRSGLVVALYLCRLNLGGTMPPQQAIDLIRSKRPGALSNQKFVDYLLGLTT